MEKGTNNKDINKSGKMSNKEIFFIQRWMEILNVNTHSKYAVRYLNSHQALKELVYVCDGMVNGDIKPNDYHLELVIKEAQSIISSDTLFKKKEANYYKIVTNRLQSPVKVLQKTKLFSLIYQINYILKYLETSYLEWIVEEIRDFLFSESNDDYKTLEKSDLIISSLVSELLSRGWSLHRLYELIKKDFLTSDQNEAEKWEDFFRSITGEKKNYICLFSFTSTPPKKMQSKMKEMSLDVMTGKEVYQTYLDGRLNPHISDNQVILRVSTMAFDYHAAVDQARTVITKNLDVLQFYGFRAPEIEETAVIIDPHAQQFYRNITSSLVINKKKYQAPDSVIDVMMKQLKNGGHSEINRKIRSVLEFSRISEESLSPQSAFINLWIALESFVQTKENDGGIDNVKNNVSAASSHNYVFALVKNLMEDCKRCHLKWQEYNETEGPAVKRKKEYEFMDYLLDEEKANKLALECDKVNILLGFRYRQIRYMVVEGKKASKVIENHRENVKRHLQRLYRIRNSIVHTGDSPYNISLFINHLNEYIESTISVVLYRLKTHEISEFEEVFTTIRDSVEYTVEVLGALSKEHGLEKQDYENLLLNGVF